MRRGACAASEDGAGTELLAGAGVFWWWLDACGKKDEPRRGACAHRRGSRRPLELHRRGAQRQRPRNYAERQGCCGWTPAVRSTHHTAERVPAGRACACFLRCPDGGHRDSVRNTALERRHRKGGAFGWGECSDDAYTHTQSCMPAKSRQRRRVFGSRVGVVRDAGGTGQERCLCAVQLGYHDRGAQTGRLRPRCPGALGSYPCGGVDTLRSCFLALLFSLFDPDVGASEPRSRRQSALSSAGTRERAPLRPCPFR